MATEVSGRLVTFKVSEDDVAENYQTIVCEENSTWSGDADVTNRPTKCGSFQTVGAATYEVTGTGVAVGDLAADQVSYNQMQQWLDTNTRLFFIRENAVSGTIAAGEVVYQKGQGYFASVGDESDQGEAVTYDFTFAVTGTVDFTK